MYQGAFLIANLIPLCYNSIMEYGSQSDKPIYKVTERQFDKAVETFGSVDEAYRHLGVTPDEVDFGPPPPLVLAPTTPTPNTLPPLAVDVAKRAHALGDVVAYYNKASKTRGSAVQMENPNSDFVHRYGRDADRVQGGAEAKTHELLYKFRRAIGELAAADTMRAHGFDDDTIQRYYIGVQAEVNKDLGIGNASAAERRRALKKARKAAGLP